MLFSLLSGTLPFVEQMAFCVFRLSQNPTPEFVLLFAVARILSNPQNTEPSPPFKLTVSDACLPNKVWLSSREKTAYLTACDSLYGKL